MGEVAALSDLYHQHGAALHRLVFALKRYARTAESAVCYAFELGCAEADPTDRQARLAPVGGRPSRLDPPTAAARLRSALLALSARSREKHPVDQR